MSIAPTGERSWLALQSPALELANAIAGTDFVPQHFRNNPAAITAAILYGDEVGLGPMQSLAKIAVINGRPTLAAEAQRALILHAGHDLWIEESSINRCTVCGRRRDSDAISRITWTTDDAKRAGLAGKQPYRLYPRQMLLARASAELARAVFPDAIGGLAASEELEDDPGATVPLANGAPPPPEPKTRRRRANVSAAVSSAETPSPPSPEPTPPPEPSREPPSEPAPSPQLPPEEQAIIDELKRDLDATEVASVPETPSAVPEPEPGVPPINEAQRRKIHALFREHGMEDRPARLSYCSAVIGREVPSSTDLSLDEASQVIQHLEQFDRDDEQTWPQPEGF